jgi:hypothetical protein
MLEEAFNTDQLVQGIEGKVIAELFDAESGELVQREETHNFISKPALEFLKKAQRYQFSRGVQILNNSLNQDYFQVDKSDAQLVLTDNASAEDVANETHMYGKMLGWSSRATYSGGDVYRGSPNGSLSTATDTQVQWVFDWPTHAANGTINSIGWVKLQHVDTSAASPAYAAYSKATAQYASPQRWTYFSRASATQSFGNTGNTTISILDGSYSQTSSFSVSTQFTAVRGIAWDAANSKLWVIGTSGGVAKIASYNSSGTLVDSLVTVTNRTYTAMAFDGIGLWTTTQSGATATIYKIDTSNGTDINSFSFATNQTAAGVYGSNCVVTGIAYEASKQTLWIREHNTYKENSYPNREAEFRHNESGTSAPSANDLCRILCFNTNGQPSAVQISQWMISQQLGTSLYSSFHSSSSDPYNIAYSNNGSNQIGYYAVNGNISPSTTYNADLDVIDAYTFVLPHDSKVYHGATDGLGSRALLGTPIVKTNSQTLRITYQVNFT